MTMCRSGTPTASIEMGGVFTVMKVREALAAGDYKDPGSLQASPTHIH
jgi:hypothetical protein